MRCTKYYDGQGTRIPRDSVVGWSALGTVTKLGRLRVRPHEHFKSLEGLAVGSVIAEACFLRSVVDPTNLARRIESAFSPIACGAAPVAGARQNPRPFPATNRLGRPFEDVSQMANSKQLDGLTVSVIRHLSHALIMAPLTPHKWTGKEVRRGVVVINRALRKWAGAGSLAVAGASGWDRCGGASDPAW